MNEHKLTHKEQESLETSQRSETKAAALEFETPEAMLRHDAAHTAVPPGIAERLKQSMPDPPSSRPAWWRRIFGRPG